MAQLTFLGSCREIGRSGFYLEVKDESFLVDYGTKFTNPPTYPDMPSSDNLQGVAITHAHLDHSGGIPRILAQDEAISLFCTPATRDLCIPLIRDMYKISKGRLPFTNNDIARIHRQCQPTAYEQTTPIGRNFEMTLFNAGHIPGSAMVSIRYNGKRILFTGDFNNIESRLNPGARKNLPKHDIVVSESTYARRLNPNREEIEEAMVQSVIETVERGGIALIPAFAIGRSQEIMCILEKYDIPMKYPIYVDGMARKVNEVVVKHPEYISSPQSFERAVKRAHVVHDNRDRQNAIRKPGIIIAPAGMLKGGASHLYFKMLYDDPKNSIILVSFQIPGTPGAELMSRRKAVVGNREFNVEAQVMYHHLSSHADSRGLVDVLQNIPGDPEFYLVHGESESCDALAAKLEKKGKTAHIPEINQTFEV
ncbi:MAG: MBL fold metallo-hydrolase [Candidatus Thorarchaeota archaeon]|nr:MBL fold metallo-hydrolase [Candidatus Thorarchaeota archaeon]